MLYYWWRETWYRGILVYAWPPYLQLVPEKVNTLCLTRGGVGAGQWRGELELSFREPLGWIGDRSPAPGSRGWHLTLDNNNMRIISLVWRSRISPLWKTMSLEDFSTSTSLHGWHFINDARDGKHKLAWGLLIALSISIWVPTIHVLASPGLFAVVAAVSTVLITLDFLNSKVVITIDSPSASLDQVIFPAVTFCNINQGNILQFWQLQTYLLIIMSSWVVYGFRRINNIFCTVSN